MTDPQIKYDINADVTGTEKIDQLAARLDDMGKILDGELATAAKTAAADLRTLGEQQAAITAFAKLSAEVKTSEQALALAQRSAKSFAQAIGEAGPPTAEQAAMLAKLASQTTGLQTSLDAQKQTLKSVGQELTTYGITGERVIEAQRQTAASFQTLRTNIEAAIPGITQITSAIQAEKDAAQLAAAAQKSAANDYTTFWSRALDQREADERAAAEAVKDAAQLAAAAQKNAANDYTTFWSRALDQREADERAATEAVKAVAQAEKDAASAAKAASDTINNAWGTLGVKTFAQTQAEITKVKTALDTVKASGASPVEIKMATEAAQAKIKELETGVKATSSAAGGLSELLTRIGPLMAGAFSAQQFLSAITSAEALSHSYTQIFGSAQAARQEMEFIRATSNKLGVDTLDLAKSYQSLAASTKGTTLEGQATRDVFEAVSRAMSVMGKSSAETGNALNAIAQMSSKGTVAMEELRGQLGEALPGALKAAADGAGLTTEQLINMVSSGSVLAKDMLPALTKGLNDLYAKAAPPQTVISEWARFKNQITDTAIAIGEGGASKGIASALTGMATAAKYASLGVDILGTSIGEGAAALVTWNGTLTTSQDLHKKYGIAKADEARATDAATAATKQNTAAAQENFRASELAAQKTAVNTLAIQAHYAELTKGAKLYAEQQKATSDAQTKEHEVLTKLVSLYGTEAEKRQVTSTVMQEQADSAQKLATAQNVEVVIATSYVLKLQEQARATKDTSQATKDQIEAAQNNVKALQTEFEKTNALAQAKHIDAAASQAQEQALKDNSSRVYEYAGKVASAKDEVARLTQAHKDGKATDSEVIKAKTDLATATLLYRDAVKDLADNYHQLGIKTPEELQKIATANASAWDKVKNDSSLSTASLKTAFETYAKSAMEATGKIGSDQYLITAETLRTEAAVHALSVSFDDNGKIIVKTQQEALKELEKTNEGLGKQKDGVDAVTSALERQNATRERAIAAQEKQNELTQRAIDLENKRRSVDSSGFSTDKDGKRIDAGGDLTTRTGILKFLQSAGVTDEAAARRLTNEFTDNQGNIAYMGNEDQKKYGGSTISDALLKAAESWTFSPAGIAASAAKTSTSTPPTTLQTTSALQTAPQTGQPSPSTQTQSASTSHTVTVNLAGIGNTTINTASAGDATNLSGLIQQLARAKTTSGL